ncbi:MAG TPA: hypothetical protein VG755_42090, partial [Nannocystaceae bacterium]|nr:hypothetical protein [Nannocystaceae bacterium]
MSPRLHIGGLLCALCFARTADAAPPPEAKDSGVKYHRDPTAKVPGKNLLETRVKKAQSKADADRKKRVTFIDPEIYGKQRAATAEDIADVQIKKMRELIAITENNSPELPDLLYRLADLHLEKKAFFMRQAEALYEPIYEHEQAGNQKAAKQLAAKQKRLEQQGAAAAAKAVDAYQVLATKPVFAKYKKLDEAIYFLAFELGQLGREAEMQDAYLRLLRDFPTSRYIPNALLSFADFYYGKNRIAEALKLYQKITDGYQDSPVYAYALYKMGWCYLNPIGTAEPEYAKSLDKFVATIEATLEGRAGNEENAKQLRRDARRDLVKAYVHAGKPSK